MSYYTTCNIEFKKEYAADLLPVLREMGDCFTIGYVTSVSIVAQFNGRHYDVSGEWQALTSKASDLEEVHEDEIFRTMTYDEFSIEEYGMLSEGVAYIDLCVDNFKEKYYDFAKFIKALEGDE